MALEVDLQGSHRGTVNGWENFPTRGRFSGEGSVFSVNRGHESAAPEVAESLQASRLPWVMKFYLNKAASKIAKAPLPPKPRRRSLPVPVSVPLPRARVCCPPLADGRGGSGFSPANGWTCGLGGGSVYLQGWPDQRPGHRGLGPHASRNACWQLFALGVVAGSACGF